MYRRDSGQGELGISEQKYPLFWRQSLSLSIIISTPLKINFTSYWFPSAVVLNKGSTEVWLLDNSTQRAVS